MRTHTSGFSEALKTLGREISSVITYQSKDAYYILTTENGDYIDTEALEDLGTERGPVIYNNEALNRVNPYFNASMLKTVMKAIEIECNSKLEKDSWLNAQFGVKVSGSFEYVDFGNYYIYQEPTYNADTKSYTITAYDKMIESMTKYDKNPLSITYPISYKNLIIKICEKLGWTYNLPITFPNQDTLITEDLYSGLDLTYRDILDDLCPSSGGNFIFDNNDVFNIKYPTETSEVIDDNNLKSVNVSIGKKYGPINSLIFATSDGVEIVAKEDTTSIEENGRTQIIIKDNKLLSSNFSDSFIDDMFNQLNGLEYYIYDVDTIGLCVFEPLDAFTINHEGIDYPVLMLNDEVTITQGLTENCYVEEPEETEKEYTTSKPSDSAVKNATVLINKNNSEIFLKVNADGNIASCNLKTSANDGSEFKVKADNINFESYTFDLKTDKLNIISDNVDINNDGITLRNGAIIVGANGVLATIIQPSNIISGTFLGGSALLPMGFSWLGDGTYSKDSLQFDFQIPTNFIIESAYITLNHIPVDYYNTGVFDRTGYSRNLKLYKVNNVSGGKLKVDYDYYLFSTDNYGSWSEITGVFGSGGFTGLSGGFTTVDSIDIKEYLTSGFNSLKIQTDYTTPTTQAQMRDITGACNGIINITGYLRK